MPRSFFPPKKETTVRTEGAPWGASAVRLRRTSSTVRIHDALDHRNTKIGHPSAGGALASVSPRVLDASRPFADPKLPVRPITNRDPLVTTRGKCTTSASYRVVRGAIGAYHALAAQRLSLNAGGVLECDTADRDKVPAPGSTVVGVFHRAT